MELEGVALVVPLPRHKVCNNFVTSIFPFMLFWYIFYPVEEKQPLAAL